MQFNLAILFVIILIIYLAILITKDYPKLKVKLIDTFKSKLFLDKLFRTRQYLPTKDCLECDGANLSDYNINISKEVGNNQIRKFQFRTVDDAWNKENRILAPYIKDGEETALLSPDFEVVCLSWGASQLKQ